MSASPSDSEPRFRSGALVLLLVFGLVVAVRASYWASLEASPLSDWYRWKATDEHGYLEWSGRIARGNILDVPAWRAYFDWQRPYGTPEMWDRCYPKNAYFTGPLYAYGLASFQALFGSMIVPARGFQLLLAAIASVAVAAAARRLLSGRVRESAVFAGSLVAGVLYGAYGPLVFHDGFIYRDGPVAHVSALLMAGPVLLGSVGPLAALGLGLLAGLSLLLKQSLLPLVFVAFAAAGTRIEKGRRRRAWFLAAAFGLCLGLLPLILRNRAARVAPLTVDTKVALGIAWGNVDGADGTTTVPEKMFSIVSRARGSTFETARLVWHSYDGHRSSLFALLARKLVTFFNRYEVPDNSNFYFFADRLAPLPYLPGFLLLFGPGIVGIMAAFRARILDNRQLLLVVTAFGTPLLACLLVQTVSRYRCAVAGPIALGCGLGLALMLDRSRAPIARRALAWGVLGAAALTAATLAPSVIRDPRHRFIDTYVAAILAEARDGPGAGDGEIRRYLAEGADDPSRNAGTRESRRWLAGVRLPGFVFSDESRSPRASDRELPSSGTARLQ